MPAGRVARPMPGKRPVGLTFVSLGFLVLGGGLGLVGLLLLAVRAPGAEAEAATFLGAWWPPGVPVAPVLLGSGLALAVLGAGLLRGLRWAWVGAVAVAGLAALSGLLGMAMGDAGALLGLLVWAGVAFYLLQPEVRAHLGMA